MPEGLKRLSWITLLTALLITMAPENFAAPLAEAFDIQEQTVTKGRKSQQRVERLDEQTQTLLNEFREASMELENLQVYHRQLSKLIDSQEQEKQDLVQQLEDIEVTQRSILPLMLRMLGVLEKFVALDAPFLREERTLRVNQLRELMDRSDVTLAEKYRRLLDAYLVEVEYGRTLEAYTGPQQVAGETRSVDFLRFGRLGFYYLTLDGDEAGSWNRQEKRWEKLPESYRSTIEQGIRIAKKQAAPDLLKLPVSAPEEAR
ncbi:energy transducer TonB [Nitrosococcus oceani]|nr:energy transducer TonB [Nitrosococcus oceani]